jgi:NitT/TauT family transport system substrate-binding protein
MLAALVCAGAAIGACGGETASGTPAPSPVPTGAAGLDEVRLQLQWLPQAQFAGYFAAVEQGYYEANGIAVTIVPGGPDVVPQEAGSAAGGPEFTISWVPKVLRAREASPASDLVDIAQVFGRSGTVTMAWREAEITSPADLRDRKVGLWESGDELEVTAGLAGAGLEPGTDYEAVIGPPDVRPFLAGRVDVAQALIYNEYAQVLEATNPESGKLYQPTDLDVINWTDEGTAMLQDAVFARAAWLAEPGNEAIAVRFLRASFQGWIYCRTNPGDCVQYAVDAGGAGAGHQAWMMNEVNGLVWPAPLGIGVMDPASWQHTVAVSLEAGIIAATPPADAYRTDLATAALEGITDDTTGADFQKNVVEVTEGGE